MWLPWDTAAAADAFLDLVRPDLGLVMETEVWPNLMWASQRHAVPVVLVNARLNESRCEARCAGQP
uniref:3-deoxy-D-manno-octulosonic acid transferase n=1 Tax=uncultured Diaphorobacter sp. TaxID=310579 RepID=A0A060BYY6_9BURK|nr:Glycos_transf_N [uncultured Diaphorobacter sp.]